MRTVTGAIIVATIVGTGLSLTIALLAVRLEAAGYSARAIGINTAAGGVATLLAAPLIPWAARKLGVAQLLMASLIVGGLALFAFTLSSNYFVWLALRFVVGAIVTVDFVLSEYWITMWTPEGRRGFAIGVYATSMAAGFAVGPVVLAWVGTKGNLPFYLGAALFLGAAVPLRLNARGAPALETRSTKNLFTFLREAPTATLAAFLQGAVEVAGLSLLPVFALRSGLSLTDGALLAGLFILGNSVLQLPLGMLADRVDRRFLLIGLAILGCLASLVLTVWPVHPFWLFSVLVLLWGGLVGSLYPVGLSLLATLYRNEDLASANSAFVMFYAIGMLGGPPLIGAGLDLAPSGFFWVIGELLAVYLALAGGQLAFERRRKVS